ncbi:MAG: DUF1566 domain-containing protein, partial [Gammaproteobacteria bacterium]|nr:DUF1566 domain-containing protein [Gammaproteobacteria bacterium]
CTTPGIAADICINLSLNGYADWFLPSRSELNEMYAYKTAIDATAIANGGSAFVSDTYWSSTEGFSHNAWRQSFNNGQQIPLNKDITIRVRAVRAF